MSGPETSPETHTKPKRALTMRTRLWSRRVGLSRKIALILGVALAVSGLATIAALTETSLFESDLSTIIILLNLDLILALALGAVMARRIVRLWTARRRGSAGSRLHIRLVVLFSLVAVLPAILVAVFAGLFLNFGIESWFNERVRTAVNESQAVAQA
ncbi:MAG: two-component sensor histidine kinase, partial [Rhodospirillales bacterium]|nr:two-component sensor histidine kinase [Rhodospirillales bacterium]